MFWDHFSLGMDTQTALLASQRLIPSLNFSHVQVSGMFWNYFSVGMDAKAAYGFHSLRERRPWAASGRAMNQAWYGYYSLSSGWFCSAPALRNKATLQARPSAPALAVACLRARHSGSAPPPPCATRPLSRHAPPPLPGLLHA